MSVYTNIQRALDTQLNTITGSPAIAWPNTKYEPTHGTTYLQPMLLPIISELHTLNDYRRYSGLYQIDILVGVEDGTQELNLWADRVVDLFYSSLELSGGTDTIYIQNIDRGPTQKDIDDEREVYKTNVDINFIVYT